MTLLQLLGLAVAAAVVHQASASSANQNSAQPTVGPREVERVRLLALEYAGARARDLGIEPGDLMISGSNVDQVSMIHVRIRQSLRGIPVFGGEAILHYRASGERFGETIDLVPKLNVDTRPRITAADAIARAVENQKCTDCRTGAPRADLWVIRHEGKDHLAYRVRLSQNGPKIRMPVVFVDAHAGEVVWSYDNLQTDVN
jgi:Zn-dependent metalloprotease